MKISRNAIVLFCSVVTFIILLLVAAVQGTLFELQSILVAVFFAGWVALLVFCIFTLVLPRVRAAQKASRKQKSQSRATAPPPAEEIPKRSPRSNLPVRERISAYVEERRREEGIPAPALLRPTRSSQAAAAAAPHIAPSVSSTEELPGIDENLEFDLGADVAAEAGITAPSGSDELPGFDGDLDLDGMGAEDIVGADDLGLDDSFDSDGGSSELDSTGDASNGDLPGFDGDLDVGSDALDDLGDIGDDSMATDGSGDEMESLDDSGFDDFQDAGDDSFDADGGDDLMTMDDSGDEMESLDDSGFDDFQDAGDDSFDADGGDDLMTMDDAGMDDSMLDDSSMESDGGLPDFDGDLDAPMDDGDLMLADDDFGDLEEIGDLEP